MIFWFLLAFLLTWAVGLLAAVRMTRALVYESVFEGLRTWLGSTGASPLRAWFAAMLECHWCTGFWVSGLMVAWGVVAAVVAALLPWWALLAIPLLWPATAQLQGWMMDLEE